mmetsp:Transcript_26836/g.72379  ORF Transcript_26836/g.72379 Transcript_26836/m.72379 type:complete len:495 (+) Transcript_26836:705-2189(+)
MGVTACARADSAEPSWRCSTGLLLRASLAVGDTARRLAGALTVARCSPCPRGDVCAGIPAGDAAGSMPWTHPGTPRGDWRPLRLGGSSSTGERSPDAPRRCWCTTPIGGEGGSGPAVPAASAPWWLLCSPRRLGFELVPGTSDAGATGVRGDASKRMAASAAACAVTKERMVRDEGAGRSWPSSPGSNPKGLGRLLPPPPSKALPGSASSSSESACSRSRVRPPPPGGDAWTDTAVLSDSTRSPSSLASALALPSTEAPPGPCVWLRVGCVGWRGGGNGPDTCARSAGGVGWEEGAGSRASEAWASTLVLPAPACGGGRGRRHLRLRQACFFTPGPPYLGLSRQFLHAPQSWAMQPAQEPQRRLLGAPDPGCRAKGAPSCLTGPVALRSASLAAPRAVSLTRGTLVSDEAVGTSVRLAWGEAGRVSEELRCLLSIKRLSSTSCSAESTCGVPAADPGAPKDESPAATSCAHASLVRTSSSRSVTTPSASVCPGG